MPDKTININKTSTGCNFTDGDGNGVASITIDNNGGVIVSIGTGFAANAEVTGLTLFNDVNGAKGTQNLGSWSSSAPNSQPSTAIQVTNNGTGIKIRDTNNTTAEVDFFFSVNGSDDNGTFTSDPELKVKRMNG